MALYQKHSKPIWDLSSYTWNSPIKSLYDFSVQMFVGHRCAKTRQTKCSLVISPGRSAPGSPRRSVQRSARLRTLVSPRRAANKMRGSESSEAGFIVFCPGLQQLLTKKQNDPRCFKSLRGVCKEIQQRTRSQFPKGPRVISKYFVFGGKIFSCN